MRHYRAVVGLTGTSRLTNRQDPLHQTCPWLLWMCAYFHIIWQTVHKWPTFSAGAIEERVSAGEQQQATTITSWARWDGLEMAIWCSVFSRPPSSHHLADHDRSTQSLSYPPFDPFLKLKCCWYGHVWRTSRQHLKEPPPSRPVNGLPQSRQWMQRFWGHQQ